MKNEIFKRRVTSEYGSAEKTAVKLFNILESKIDKIDQLIQAKFRLKSIKD